MKTYKATHRLKKNFKFNEKEVHQKGCLVAMKKRHQKHFGFCCNVAFLTPTGRLRKNKDGAIALYSKDFFKPLKDWFEPIRKNPE